MEQFQYKEQLSSAKMNNLVNELNDNTEKLSELETAVGNKYEKPSGGIPSTDLASSVQTSISRADAIYDDYINSQNLM